MTVVDPPDSRIAPGEDFSFSTNEVDDSPNGIKMLMPSKQSRRGRRPNSGPGNGGRSGRGRPMKRFDQLKPSRKVRTLQSKIIHKQRTAEIETPKRVSTLESMPVEIIEQIFFHCLEPNLPRASPHLARVLSRPSVYSALVLFAYFDVDSSSHVETRHFLPATFRLIGCDNQMRLQEGILRCRWFTLDFFQSCMPALTRLTMVRHWYREREQLIAARSARFRQKVPGTSSYTELPNPDVILPAIDDKRGMEIYFKLRSAILPNEQQDQTATSNAPNGYLPQIIETSHIFQIRRHLQEHFTEISLHPLVQNVFAAYTIPEHIVLRKPWTDTDVNLLQFLRQAMQLRCAGSSKVVPSPQAMFDGMANAIQEGNEKALLVLLELYDTIVKTLYPDESAPLRLFHLICKEPTLPVELQCKMMSILVRGAAENVPADDEVLTRWAIHITNSSRAEHDLLIARWLLKYMERQGGPNEATGHALSA